MTWIINNIQAVINSTKWNYLKYNETRSFLPPLPVRVCGITLTIIIYYGSRNELITVQCVCI